MNLRLNSIGLTLATVLLAGTVGWLVSLTGIPMGWMIGAMLATAVASLAKLPVRKPGVLLEIVRATIGLMLGAGVTHELIASVGTWWLTLLFLVLSLGVMFVVAYLSLRKFARLDAATAALCAMPGGIAEMLLLSERQGADQTRVAIVHALRIALAILLIPLLIGGIAEIEPVTNLPSGGVTLGHMDWVWIAVCILAGFLARGRVRIPAPIVIVPMLVSAMLHLTGLTSFTVPVSITTIIQVLIGISVGARFKGVSLKSLIAALGAAALVVMLQIGTAFAGALMVAGAVGVGPIAVVLAYSPGGLAEMSIIALSLGVDVAFVGVHHVFRVMIALICAPILLTWITKKSQDQS